MTDCPNAEIRDRLPDLLHNRLDASTRAAVMAHVDGCADCREELELLRGVRKALVAATPRVKISEIVYALPTPPASLAPVRRRAPRVDWRLAAAIAVLAVGASSMTLLSRDRSSGANSTDSAQVAVTAPKGVDSVTIAQVSPSPDVGGSPLQSAPKSSPDSLPSPSAPAAAVASAADAAQEGTDATAAVHLAGLSQGQLKALVADIDQMQAVPLTDPQPVAIRVASSTPEGM